jgi:hypothetical protein
VTTSTLPGSSSPIGEAVRRSAANLPGYGPTDVFYPASWQGVWKMQRESVALESTTTTGAAVPEKSVLVYSVRFLPSVQDNAVIADRGFNQANLEAALNGLSTQSVVWTASNPNDLQLALADGTHKDIKVTKRATELTATTVFSSEFQRVSQYKDDRGMIPRITARRVLTKWKMNETKNTTDSIVVEGLELVYNVGDGGDLLLGAAVAPLQPTLVSKSRLRLERY